MLYLAETAVTAFLERSELRALRPNLEFCARLAKMRAASGPDDPDITPEILANAGYVEATWFDTHGLACIRTRAGQKFLDLRDTAIIERLRVHLAPWLLDHGFADLQSRDLLDDIDNDDPGTTPVTQHISELAYASGFAGIAYLSRPHTIETCWALFEGAELEPAATISPILPADPDLQRAFAIYGLRPAPDAAPESGCANRTSLTPAASCAVLRPNPPTCFAESSDVSGSEFTEHPWLLPRWFLDLPFALSAA